MAQTRVNKLVSQLSTVKAQISACSVDSPTTEAPSLNPTQKPVCVVAGAGSGLGLAILEEFAKHDFIVVGCRRSEESMQKLADELNAKLGEKVCFAYGKDMRKEDIIEDWIDEIERKFGPIEMAVYNIGANVQFSITNTTSRVFRKVWEMAAFGGFLFGKAVAKRMIPRQRGCIAFTGATASVLARSPFAAFASAKHACRGLARAMAHELNPKHIHVCHIIVDGPIDSDFMRRMMADNSKSETQKKGLMRRLMKPNEIAENYWYLYSQKPSAWTFELDLRSYCEIW